MLRGLSSDTCVFDMLAPFIKTEALPVLIYLHPKCKKSMLKIYIFRNYSIMNSVNVSKKSFGQLIGRVPRDLIHAIKDKVEFLFLDNNELRDLPLELVHFGRLRLLQASGNKIQTFPWQQGAPNFQHLRWLSLYDNLLTEIPDPIFHLEKLETLSLHHNYITTMEPSEEYSSTDSSSRQGGLFQALQHFTIHHNYVEFVPDWYATLPCLEMMDVSHNHINVFSVKTLFKNSQVNLYI